MTPREFVGILIARALYRNKDPDKIDTRRDPDTLETNFNKQWKSISGEKTHATPVRGVTFTRSSSWNDALRQKRETEKCAATREDY